MLEQLFFDSIIIIFLLTVCANSWYLYYLIVNSLTTPTIQSNDRKKSKTIEINKNIRTVIIGFVILWFILINNVFIFIMNNSSIFCDTLYLSHSNISYLYLLLFIFIIILCAGIGLFNQNISFSSEYLIFVLIIIISSYLLISSSNLFLTIFLLEFIALLIFGKMSTSRVVVKKSSANLTSVFNKNQYSYGLFNSLFFQFWANFVSSICLFFSLLNIHYMFGTSHFFIINFLLNLNSSNWYLVNTFLSITLILLINGLFIKLGLSPYQFFKIEIYKGIPIYILIVYTTLYLISYIYLFIILFVYQLTSLREFTGFYIIFIISISLVYLVNLLFDTKNFKSFLAYSTLITISNLFLVVLIL